MYGKLFSSLYQGTLRGCSDEILVFTNLIAHADMHGIVDKHWRSIAEETGLDVERVKTAIANLEAPDPESRSPEMEGRRIVPMDEHRAWGWQIVNHGKYRSIKNEDDRREQNRLAQQKWREKQRNQDKPTVSTRKQSKPPSAHTDTDTDTDTEEEKEKTVATAPVVAQDSMKNQDHLHHNSSSEKNGGSAPTTDHAQLMKHHADRVGRITDGAKQGALIKQLLKQFTVEECIACYDHQTSEEWRKGQVSWATVIDGTRGIATYLAEHKPSEPSRSYNYVKGQPTQREAIEAEQRAIELMNVQ